MSFKPEDSDEGVGFSKPPKQWRFKPGQSGNPKGRPKGQLNFSTALQRTLRETVVVNENGRRKIITKLDAAVKQVSNKAASGDLRALKLITEMQRYAEEREQQKPTSPPDLTKSDQKNMQRMLARLERSPKEKTKENKSEKN